MLRDEITFICDHCAGDPEWPSAEMAVRELGDGSLCLSCPQCGADKAIVTVSDLHARARRETPALREQVAKNLAALRRIAGGSR